jgi:hypothetical protein
MLQKFAPWSIVLPPGGQGWPVDIRALIPKTSVPLDTIFAWSLTQDVPMTLKWLGA